MTAPQHTLAQQVAADPEVSAFVTANAGSGKTSTLVDRVARLLLREVKPEAILCVTYTKAAAAEMQGRLYERLGGWAVASDEALRDDLIRVGEDPERLAGGLSDARKLFAKALETPGGLKIQTLHAFCEALLRRFPLEAGVAPGFSVLDDAEAAAVSAGARDRLAELALIAPTHAVALAYAHFAVELDLASFDALLKTFESERKAIETHVESIGGIARLAKAVWAACGFDDPFSVDGVQGEAVAACDWDHWRRAAEALGRGGRQDQSMAALLGAAIAGAGEEPDRFALCWSAFSTAKGEPKSERSLFTQATPGPVQDWLKQEQARLQEALTRVRSARVAEDTVHALTLAYAYAELYEGEKQARGALDFPDLTDRAHQLLTERASAAWVLFKLDGGIDHVLLDEAQDTAPDQWDILEALTGEFFTGHGQTSERALARTVFAVGDEKQSIYSFQGARPEQLQVQTQAYGRRAYGAERALKAPRLEASFRSTPEVLGFVDALFGDPATQQALTPGDATPIAHIPTRPAGAGSVELWPLEVDAPHDPPDAWDPVDTEPPESARKRLARKVAQAVKTITTTQAVIDKGTGQPRAATPGDVLILVRKRDAVFEEVIRALKLAEVPVAGADRLKLSDHIVFADVLALIRVCLFPQDDLRLAAILRSPFCSLDENSLFDLAWRREGSLWAALCRRADERPEWREALAFLGWARGLVRPPFAWLGRVLSYRDAAGRSMRQRLLTRLGREAEDALDELLAEALKAEGRGVYELERFAAVLERSEIEVKRELEAASGEVRVMTVHGAKGLEAPIVLLPDTAAAPPQPRGPLLRTPDGGFLFAPRKAEDSPASAAARAHEARRQAEEGLRLLYVALTRARDRVIAAGRLPGNAKNGVPEPESWYARIEAAFDRPEIAEQVRTVQGVRRYGADPGPAPAAIASAPRHILPSWTQDAPAPEPAAARYAAPSTLAETERGPAPSPLDRTQGLGRYRRGELIHKLLEVLPDLPPAVRADGARRLLNQARDLTEEQRAEMAAAAFGVLDDPSFAEVFGPGSIAEAAIAGSASDLPAGLNISGRMDRMVVTPDRVLVVDFKTNRPAPARIEDADRAYVVQMAIYAAVLRALYPGRAIEAALIWTDGPKLMPVPEILIDRTLAALRGER